MSTRLNRRVWITVVIALGIAGGGVRAQSSGSPPDGVRVGRWIIRPYADLGYGYDSNVFFVDNEVRELLPGEQPDPLDQPIASRIRNLGGEIQAMMPVHNSLLEFAYRIDYTAYEEAPIEPSTSHDFGVAWTMNFRTRDRLTLSDNFISSIFQTDRVDPAQELRFQAVPYRFNTWSISLDREIPRKQGYEIQVTRRDFNVDEGGDLTQEEIDARKAFFNYRGFEAGFEYRQPFGRHIWMTFLYGTRRFNNYEPLEFVGVPFRKEEGDTFQLGVRGYLGEDQPFFFRLGREVSTYTLRNGDRSSYTGITGQMRWRLKLGGRSGLDLGGVRRTQASSFSDFIIFSEVSTRFERQWLQRATWGLDGRLWRNQYNGPCSDDLDPDGPGPLEPSGPDRDDFTFRAEAFLQWMFSPRYALRGFARRSVRQSNCLGEDYNSSQVAFTFVVGWF